MVIQSMSEESDFYQLLGVHPKSSGTEIKEAFRRLAQKYHPDRGTIDPESVELFKRMTEAYRTLMDPESRNEYNKEHGYLFHEEVSVGGVTGEGVQSETAKESSDSNVDLSGVERDMMSLHKMASSENDLNMHQKVASHDMEKLIEEDEGPEVAAWGDLDSAPVSGGILSNLLSGRRKDKGFQNRGELKKNLKKTMQEESKPKKPSHVLDAAGVKASIAPRPEKEDSAKTIENPLQSERIYRFQITSLEAAFGTTRELVLSHGGDDRISKVEVDIPSGIESGTIIEVARGWERANVEITVVQDPRFEVVDKDIHLRVPITLKEALDGARVKVPGIRESHELTLNSGDKATHEVRIEKGGIGTEGGLVAKPYIVAPSQFSATLVAAAKVVDQHIDITGIRSRFSDNPLAQEFCSETETQLTFFPPITFSEVVQGCLIEFAVRSQQISVDIPANWDHRANIELSNYLSSLGKLVVIEPHIVLPQRSSADLQAAALAIEQHYLVAPRAHLPRQLSKK